MSKQWLKRPVNSMAAAEMADLEEALLRGELSRADFETIISTKYKKKK